MFLLDSMIMSVVSHKGPPKIKQGPKDIDGTGNIEFPWRVSISKETIVYRGRYKKGNTETIASGLGCIRVNYASSWVGSGRGLGRVGDGSGLH